MLERRSEDELRHRLRQQAAVAELGRRALAGMPLGELMDEAVRVVATELGAPLVTILEPGDDDGALLARAAVGMPDEPAQRRLLAGEPDGQFAFTLAAGDPVVAADLEGEGRFRPAPVLIEGGMRSSASVPIAVGGRTFGVLVTSSRRLDDFSEDDLSYLQSMANTLAAVFERERSERDIRTSEARFRELADAAPVFIWTADASGMVDFINRGWLEFTGRSLKEEMGDSWELGVHPDDAETVRSTWARAFQRRVPWEREYRLRRHDGEYRWIVDRGVPRFEGEELVGYIGTATDIHERREMEEKLSLAYARDHEVAETLQRSLLPDSLPRIDGVQLEARYLPASRGAAIGGDWYDALELDDGRIAVVVGDVVGHGLRAATMMGQLRNAFRAYALIEPSPSETLSRLNRLVMKDGRDLMATALSLVLDRDTGEVRYSSAGHPPPLLVGPEGSRYLEGGGSVPLGTGDPAAYRDELDRVEPGCTLLLYTDGLVERRDTPLDDRLAQLASVAEVADGVLGDVCDQILGGMLGGRRPPDDVALLAVRLEPVGAGGVRLRIPADPGALAPLRRRMGRFLQAVGASEQERYEITLTVCEAAANAIEHAYGPGDAEFEVEARLDDGEVQIAVRDSGHWRERRGQDRGRGLRIIEGLMDETQVTPLPGGTTVTMRRRLGAAAAVERAQRA